MMNLLLAYHDDDEITDLVKLVKQAKEGDEGAFEKLFRHCSHRIYQYLRPKLRDEDEMDDLVQDIFLTVWLHLRELREPCNFRSWLYSIAQNKLLNHLRHKKIFIGLLWRWKDPDTPIAIYEQSPRDLVLLKLALEQVDPIYRKCLILQEVHNLKQKEIAEIVGISKNSVSKYVYRGLLQLRIAYQYLDIFFRSTGL